MANINALDCRLALKQADRESWEYWAKENKRLCSGEMWSMDRYLCLTYAQVLLAQGEAQKALDLLEPWKRFLGNCGRVIDLIDMRLLSAIALHSLEASQKPEGYSLDWRKELVAALEASYEYGYVRPTAQLGAAILPLLDELQWAGDQKFFTRVLNSTRKQACHYPEFLRGMDHDPSLLPSLTKTELKVLRLLAKDYSNAQIMEELGIKLPTVKAHVQHIMRKLDAHSRGQAKTIARELDII